MPLEAGSKSDADAHAGRTRHADIRRPSHVRDHESEAEYLEGELDVQNLPQPTAHQLL